MFKLGAREEASLGAIGHEDSHPFSSKGASFFEAIVEAFFRKWCQMESQMASKMLQNLIKNELETKSTKHVEHVLNLIPLDLQETRFRMEKLPKITKIRGADKCQKNNKK